MIHQTTVESVNGASMNDLVLRGGAAAMLCHGMGADYLDSTSELDTIKELIAAHNDTIIDGEAIKEVAIATQRLPFKTVKDLVRALRKEYFEQPIIQTREGIIKGNRHNDWETKHRMDSAVCPTCGYHKELVDEADPLIIWASALSDGTGICTHCLQVVVLVEPKDALYQAHLEKDGDYKRPQTRTLLYERPSGAVGFEAGSGCTGRSAINVCSQIISGGMYCMIFPTPANKTARMAAITDVHMATDASGRRLATGPTTDAAVGEENRAGYLSNEEMARITVDNVEDDLEGFDSEGE